jgi:hypothetical protein
VHQRAVPDIDRDQAGLRHADAGDLNERHLRAIGLDHDRIEHMGGGSARAQTGQFGLEHRAGALHAALDLVDIVRFVCHGDPPNTTPLVKRGSA